VRRYWELLAGGNRRQAMEYVEPSTREVFLARSTPDFSSPRLTELSLGTRDDEVDVTVYVKRLMPPLTGQFDFRVIERWVLRNGQWYVVIKVGSTPYDSPTRPAVTSTGPPPQEVERRRASLQRDITFASRELDFGRVDQGVPAVVPLVYRLDGNEPAEIRVVKSSAAFDPRGLVTRQIVPGEGRIDVEFLTSERDSPVEEPVTIAVRRDEVEVTFDFVLKGMVYAPISVTPRPLRFLEGEYEAEVTIRNNSSSAVRIVRYFNEDPAFSASPIPLVMEPGQTAKVQIRRPKETTAPNVLQRVALVFAELVDGRGNVQIPLVLNYVETARPKSGLPPEVEEWLRKNKPSGLLPP
jgi:hypothetical protein